MHRPSPWAARHSLTASPAPSCGSTGSAHLHNKNQALLALDVLVDCPAPNTSVHGLRQHKASLPQYAGQGTQTTTPRQGTESATPRLTWQYDEQLNCKLWQLKGHTAALSTPLLLPDVEPVGDQAPADADHALTCHNLFTCSVTKQPAQQSAHA